MKDKKKSKRGIAVFDIETDPFRYGRTPEPFIFGYFNGAEYRQFYDISEFVEFIKSRDEIIYAHNGGKFDFHFLTDFFEEGSVLSIINGRIAKVKFGRAELRDSYCILPFALSAYEKSEFDYTILERDCRDEPENKLRIEEYLRSDCVNLYTIVSAFNSRFGIHLTVAGTAFSQWKKISGRELPHSKNYYYDQFYPFYYGGRVECFQHGIIDKRFTLIDINSAYPRAMLELMPYGLGFEVFESMPALDDASFDTNFYVIEGISEGCFPLRLAGGGLDFPSDTVRRQYFVTGWELRAAIDTGTIQDWEFLYGYKHYERVSFKEYVEHFYEERLKAKAAGDVANDIFSKLMMNSLYGKFASDPRKYGNYSITEDEKVRDAAIISLRADVSFAGNFGKWFVIETALTDKEMVFYNIATAASITGYVRASLWRAICAAGKENVLYCDTDSLATSRTDNIIFGEGLGEWKDEGEFVCAGIAGKKLYAFKREDGSFKYASKGSRITPEEIMKVAQGGRINFRFDAPSFSIGGGVTFIAREISMTSGELK